ncbi:MAG: hypothetical protein LBF00_00210 [Mycoplasmataceae bacterium]|nr:hypothetical protein [Mycoplasmataceae bacterium]
MEERIAEAIVKTVPSLIDNALTKALEPIVSRLNEQGNDIKNINARLDKQDEFNKVVIDYMKSHP